MTTVIWEFKKAVYTALSGDSTLAAMVTGIFDHVPEDSDYPYVTITSVEAEDWSNKATTGYKITMEIGVYCRDRGSKTCLDISGRIHTLLHDSDLTVSGAVLVSLRFDAGRTDRGRDGLSYRGEQLYKALLEVL